MHYIQLTGFLCAGGNDAILSAIQETTILRSLNTKLVIYHGRCKDGENELKYLCHNLMKRKHKVPRRRQAMFHTPNSSVLFLPPA